MSFYNKIKKLIRKLKYIRCSNNTTNHQSINQMKKLIYVMALLCVSISFSQSKSFKITGKILSEDNKEPLEAATVYLERLKDSSLVTYTISNKDGLFEIIDETYDEKLNLFIDFVGYRTYFKQIAINNKDVIDIGHRRIRN